jgi:hypothetical protein
MEMVAAMSQYSQKRFVIAYFRVTDSGLLALALPPHKLCNSCLLLNTMRIKIAC